MKITEFETWWVNRDKCLFDAKRQGGALMNWDVIVIRIGTDAGIDGIATCLAARSGGVSENYLYDNIAPLIMGRDTHCLLNTTPSPRDVEQYPIPANA